MNELFNYTIVYTINVFITRYKLDFNWNATGSGNVFWKTDNLFRISLPENPYQSLTDLLSIDLINGQLIQPLAGWLCAEIPCLDRVCSIKFSET
jgi:hypothetical protein